MNSFTNLALLTALLSGGAQAATLRGLASQEQPPASPSSTCLTSEDAKTTINGFMRTVKGISNAYFVNGGGDASSVEEVLAGNTANKEGCLAAYRVAIGALENAYNYSPESEFSGEVLFKPTLTSVGQTYRTTLAGALSYFIGTECLLLSGSGLVFPEGNVDGSIFQEYGFGINNYPSPGSDIASKGWKNVIDQDFVFQTNGAFCDSPLAMGRICFTTNPVPSAGIPSQTSCVDKTFSFVAGEPSQGLNAVIASHHSSSSIVEDTITACQETPVLPTITRSLNPGLPICQEEEPEMLDWQIYNSNEGEEPQQLN